MIIAAHILTAVREGVNGDNTQSEIKAKVNGDMNIKAVFEKDIV